MTPTRSTTPCTTAFSAQGASDRHGRTLSTPSTSPAGTNSLVAVRGGGHSVAGHSSCDGGMVIDLTRMRGVDVDPQARVARVQGGAVWGDVDRGTQAFGLVVPGGVVSETGVAGLTLEGARDGSVASTASRSTASCRRASSARTAPPWRLPSSEPDLFWAIRGGGGNFGIVTSFEFRAHPLGPIVGFAGVFYSGRREQPSSFPGGAITAPPRRRRFPRSRWPSRCRPPRRCPSPSTTRPAFSSGAFTWARRRRA